MALTETEEGSLRDEVLASFIAFERNCHFSLAREFTRIRERNYRKNSVEARNTNYIWTQHDNTVQ